MHVDGPWTERPVPAEIVPISSIEPLSRNENVVSTSASWRPVWRVEGRGTGVCGAGERPHAPHWGGSRSGSAPWFYL